MTLNESICEPRLSTRACLALFDERVTEVVELEHIRRTAFADYIHRTAQPAFSIDLFLSKSSVNSSSAEIKSIKDNFRFFIQQVSIIADDSAQQQDAARVMYNIIVKYKAAKESAYADAVSYFGKISPTKFDLIMKAGLDLYEAYLKANPPAQKSKTVGSSSGQEFGSHIVYHVPELIDDTAGSDYGVYGSARRVQASPSPDDSDFRFSSEANNRSKDLLHLCSDYVRSTSFTMESEQLAQEIVKLLTEKGASEDTIQVKLFELVGENGFEFMFAIMQQYESFKLISMQDLQEQMRLQADEKNALLSSTNFMSGEGLFGMMTAAQTTAAFPSLTEDLEGLSLNQRRKREKKEKERAEREAECLSKGMQDPSMAYLIQAGFSEEYLEQERMLGLHAGPGPGHATYDTEQWREGLAESGTKEYHEKKGLPAGAVRKYGPSCEEVFLPAAKKMAKATDEELVDIEQLDNWARLAFEGTKKLNRIQSAVYETAYNSCENMLVCAPTGAGKTNVAMLTFLQLVKQNISEGMLDMGAIKAVYIAPMKALAQEVVTKFGERLKPLKMTVKEFTGDMQLTRQEVLESQLLVTTPEKYDVVTRKGGDGSLGTLVNLIIIDEVHLLAEDRGAVLETIVARTQRYIESSQHMIRIVGLSATLPNYQDVAAFLRVNPRSGMFFFGPEYRPVPLDQTFVGITEKQKVRRNDIMNQNACDKMTAALERGKQVMIFVHSRKETSRTAEAMRDLTGKMGVSNLLENFNHEQFGVWKRAVEKSRSTEVQQLFFQGIGIHHAGMLRADRTMTEQMFECGIIKVLCCTATLAWGVNLPAHTVIIKGTELYDPERGGFVDLGILDVLQIFGRAGRPQYDTTGHAILITPHKSLNNYLSLLGHQAPIESGFIKALVDHMNAEVVNGTITNIKEAALWLSYTFLFVRMGKNPVAYGMSFEEKFEDPQLDRKREQLVRDAAETLDKCMMVRFDKRSGNLAVTDLGRVASYYYIKCGTIEAFNAMLTPHLSDSEALHVLCSAAEFDQLKLRPEELPEIDSLLKEAVVAVKGPVEETPGKVNVLLQAYCNQTRINSFTLMSDTNYVAQNAGRICRALFETCLKRGWCNMARYYLTLSKCIDRRMRPDQTPLRQFHLDELPRDVTRRIEETHIDINQMLDMTSKEVGTICHNQKLGSKILSLIQMLPHLDVHAVVRPITRGILRMTLTLSAAFKWQDKYHGACESFWVWVEDGESEAIYHTEHFLLSKKTWQEDHLLELTLPIREPLPPQYYVRTMSDRWVGCESTITVSFQHLILPDQKPPHTNLLDIHPVPRTALQNPTFESLYRFSHFNPIQSQTFHTLYHTDANVLVGAPTGSGKTIIGEIAMLRLLHTRPGAKIVYVAPLKALARERLTDWKRKLGDGLGLSVLELTGEVTPDLALLKRADVLVVTPEKWDGISRGWAKREYVQRVELMIIDEIHLLGVDRGPVLEVIVSRMRFISAQTSNPIRFVGLSTALANPRDLADWLGIGSIGLYNFRPSVRPIPMTIHIQGFAGKHYCPRMATMNKPTYAAILEHSPVKPALVFVSSRRQTRLTALDLISYCASDDNPKKFLKMPEEDIIAIASTLKDSALRDTIVFGIGIHHAGLDNHDRNTVEELFTAAKIQVLVCTSTLAWGVNLPCHLVVVKGTEFFDGKLGRYVDSPVTDVLQMMGRAGRPQYDVTGVACIMVAEPKKNFYKKFLHEPFPVESSLHKQMHDHINAEVANGTLVNIGDCVEYLTWTYYFRRLVMNPSYYELEDSSTEAVEKHLTSMVEGVLSDLVECRCIIFEDGFRVFPTPLGKISSQYYLFYKTIGLFKNRLDDWRGYVMESESNGNYGTKGHKGRDYGRGRGMGRGEEEEDEEDKQDEKEMYDSDGRHSDSESNSRSTNRGKKSGGRSGRGRGRGRDSDRDRDRDRDGARGKGNERTGSLMIMERLQNTGVSMERVVRLLCQAYEFAELPVRHNEEHLNADLADELPWSSGDLDMESAHTKAFLLLQAYFFRAKLPITDYINDTKTVLDQAPRVLNALLDMAVEEGHLDVVLALTILAKMIIQGLDSEDSELLQLPHMTSETCLSFKRNGVASLESLLRLRSDVLNNITRRTLTTERSQAEFLKAVHELPALALATKMTLIERYDSNPDPFRSRLQDEEDEEDGESRQGDAYSRDPDAKRSFDFVRDGHAFSYTDNSFTLKGMGSAGTAGAGSATLSTNSTEKSSDSKQNEADIVFLTSGKEYTMKFSITVLHGNSSASVFCPQYHRGKNASYWCIVGTEEGQLLGVKKIIPSGGSHAIQGSVTFILPLDDSHDAHTGGHRDEEVVQIDGKIRNPNDKLYMNYSDDYERQQTEHRQAIEKEAERERLKREQATQKKLLVYLISDSVMGLDDVLHLPYKV